MANDDRQQIGEDGPSHPTEDNAQSKNWVKKADGPRRPTTKEVRRSYPAKENDPRKPKKKKKITQITYISELT